MADGDVNCSQLKTHLLTVEETSVKDVKELIDQLEGVSLLPSTRAKRNKLELQRSQLLQLVIQIHCHHFGS